MIARVWLLSLVTSVLQQIDASLDRCVEPCVTVARGRLDSPPPCTIELVLGWSTGHVGTSSLALPSLYADAPRVVFRHEAVKVPGDARASWARWSRADEARFVSDTYLPEVLADVAANAREGVMSVMEVPTVVITR